MQRNLAHVFCQSHLLDNCCQTQENNVVLNSVHFPGNITIVSAQEAAHSRDISIETNDDNLDTRMNENLYIVTVGSQAEIHDNPSTMDENTAGTNTEKVKE